MLHILPKGFHRIRHYGLFANTGRAANIARLRELLGSMPPAEASASPSQDEPAETVLPPCPCCGGRMTIIELFERGTLPRYRPPSAAAVWFDTS
jgi:Putative transposase